MGFAGWMGCGILGAIVLLVSCGSSAGAGPVALACRPDSPRIDFAVGRLENALRDCGAALSRHALARPPERLDVMVFSSPAEAAAFAGLDKPPADDPARQGVAVASPAVGPEGYRIIRVSYRGAPAVCIAARDETGAMYGVLDLAEEVRARGSLAGVAERLSTPRFPFRAIKFNLPWMSYRKGEALQLHMDTCRDLGFWQRFLDMMAENRFNVLTLWNLHPFTFMIRPKNFPEACPFSDQELADWQAFWRKLLRMAKDRGIETYIIDWNIFVSPEFARARSAATYSIDWSIGGNGDTSELVKRYNREVVTQTIDEYEDLAGIGISLGERMNGMTPREREQWILDTVVAGMRRASRPVKFIHRAPFTVDPMITRDAIEGLDLPGPIWVEIKFNWSHGHSSPHLSIIHGGASSDAYWNPPPKNYRLVWMIRNEDFFNLRWGEPGFIREHIRTNGQPYVGGYFVGSECYIPAKNYIDRPDLPGRCQYAFERQWLFYMLWGRLLYDPATPDAVFEGAFDARYGKGVGANLLGAYAAASRMPLRLASFHKFSWDFTLYSEGFLAPAGSKSKSPGGFISIDDLIAKPPLDPSYVSIPDYVKAAAAGKTFDAALITPPALADALAKDAEDALRRVSALPAKAGALELEAADVRAWAYLSLYFADKLRAGVALETFRRTGDAKRQAEAVALLESAAGRWDELVAVTRPIYPPVPLLHLGATKFSWEDYRDHVRRDIDIARKGK